MPGMIDTHELRAGHNRDLKRFLVFSVLMISWLAVDVYFRFDLYFYRNERAQDFARLTTYLLPMFGATSLLLLQRLSRQGPAPIPTFLAVAGIAFIVGGALFDISTTIFHSPDLSREGNPYVRTLIDAQHSLPFVYAHTLLYQTMYVVLFCTFWVGFLKHRPILIDTILAAQPVSRIEFLKAATGGAHLTTRQWLFPIRMSEMPVIYHWIWAMAVAVVFGISLFRWYAALEWLNVVEVSNLLRVCVIFVGVAGSFTLYFVALWRMCRLTVGGSVHTN